MYLAGYHKINLVRSDPEFFKVDCMRSGAFGKKHQVIKGMPVRSAQVFMMIEIGCETADQYIAGSGW